jgi:hypothetical protein
MLLNASYNTDHIALVLEYYHGNEPRTRDVAVVSVYALPNMTLAEHAAQLTKHIRHSQFPEVTIENWFYGVVTKGVMPPLAVLHLALAMLYAI